MKLIMQNKPNFQKSQMFITVISTMNYSEKCKLDTWSKQTQTKPILPASTAGKIALSAVEGPVISLSAIAFLSSVALAKEEATADCLPHCLECRLL
jgi:hypothetical protein